MSEEEETPQIVPNHNTFHAYSHFILQKQSESATKAGSEEALLFFRKQSVYLLCEILKLRKL